MTDPARRDLERCRAFLAEKAPQAAERAGAVIFDRLASLVATPHMGRPVFTEIDLRELVIPFGDAGYVALYLHDEIADAVVILAVRHYREAGYQ